MHLMMTPPHSYDTINKGNTEHKLIIGDFKVTLHHRLYSFGYKSTLTINIWLENETLIDLFRFFNPTTPSYTYRIRTVKKSSLDYCLTSLHYKKSRNAAEGSAYTLSFDPL